MNRAQRRADWIARHRAGQGGPAPSVRLHVERLVVHGLPSRDRLAIGDAVRGELTLLIAGGGLPGSFRRAGEVARLDAGTIRAGQGLRADALGVRVARAVLGGKVP